MVGGITAALDMTLMMAAARPMMSNWGIENERRRRELERDGKGITRKPLPD